MMRRSTVRICYTVDSRYAGGAERYIQLLATGLERDLFDPHVLVREEKGLDAWCGDVEAAGVPVTRIPMDMPFRPAHAIPSVRAFSSIAPHIVHVNVPGPYDGQMGLLAPLARFAGAGRVVVTEHLPRVERIWKRALVKQVAYRWVDRVTTVCRSNIGPLVERQRVAPDIIDVVYNGIDAAYGTRRREMRDSARRELDLGTSECAVVFLGSLIERKGVGVLLDALSGLAASGETGWRLYVVGGNGGNSGAGGEHGGSGTGRGAYSRRVEKAGLGGQVRLMGVRPASEVERLLCASDLLVLPSFMEGLPYVILEAMACSLPVVASRVDGIPEAVADGDTGLLVPPGDPQALGNAIGRFVGDAVLRAESGRRGRRRFETMFTLGPHISRMQRLYLELIDGGRARAGSDLLPPGTGGLGSRPGNGRDRRP